MLDNTLRENTAQIFDWASKAGQAFVSFTGATGIAGFVFDLKTDEEVSLSNDITDYYTETGEPVQENIVNKPIKVTLRGTVGEYVYNPPKKKNMFDKFKEGIENTVEKLVIIGSYIPSLGNFAQQTFDFLDENKKSYGIFDFSIDAFKAYRNINIPKNKQASAFLFFEALWRAKQTFTIQTPYRYYTNMAIETMKAVQHGDTEDNTDFEITFKQINKVQTNDVTSNLLQGRLKNQASNIIKKGYASLKDTVVSSIYKGDN